MINFQNWIQKAITFLSGSQSPRLDAEILLEFATKKSRSFIYSFSKTLLTEEQEKNLYSLLTLRKIGYPIAYLIGESEFWSLPLYVSSSTLIPRPDTECLVEQALIRLSIKPSNILDLGTGTGAIALAIASERPDCYVTLIDLVPGALEIAYRNINRLSLKNAILLKSSWFDSLFNQKFDMIVSNPPYIDSLDFHLSEGDLRFEPATALISSDNGMKDLKYIILHACTYLSSGGWLLVEHGWKQGRLVRYQFIQSGYQHVETYLDYSGNERVTVGRKII